MVTHRLAEAIEVGAKTATQSVAVPRHCRVSLTLVLRIRVGEYPEDGLVEAWIQTSNDNSNWFTESGLYPTGLSGPATFDIGQITATYLRVLLQPADGLTSGICSVAVNFEH